VTNVVLVFLCRQVTRVESISSRIHFAETSHTRSEACPRVVTKVQHFQRAPVTAHSKYTDARSHPEHTLIAAKIHSKSSTAVERYLGALLADIHSCIHICFYRSVCCTSSCANPIHVENVCFIFIDLFMDICLSIRSVYRPISATKLNDG
jgi:hypothetical protein